MATTETLWLLDTSILVDMLRGSKQAKAWIDSLPDTARLISVITAAELLAGCRSQSEQRVVERELALYETAWLDEDISRNALEHYRRYRLSHGVGFLDCVIAATARRRGARLATLNVKHFSPLLGIRAECPY